MATSTTIFRSRKTPGVYVTELEAFPPSIIGVATAIPAFIGYTQLTRFNGADYTKKPLLIKSMVDYIAAFGGPPTQDANGNPVPLFTITAKPTTDPIDFTGVDGTTYALKIDVSKPFGCLYYAMELFYANGGGACYIVSAGAYPVAAKVSDLTDALNAVADQVGPTMLVVPDGMLCAPQTIADSAKTSDAMVKLSQAMLLQCASKQDRIAILDPLQFYPLALATDATALDTDLDAAVLAVRVDVADKYLNYGVCYAPYLNTSIVEPTDLTFAHFDTAALDTLLKLETTALFPAIPDPTTNPPGTKPDPRLAMLNAIIDKMAAAAKATDQGATAKPVNQNLTASIPLLKQIYAIAAAKLGVLPASAAMAGVMTYTDQTRGVWNAPANVVLPGIEPSIKLNAEQQEDLNVPIDGKAINLIREFVGRGTVVWGARTLDGNSNDTRYVQVRRTLIYIEQSIKAALNPFVFAPNDGKTWVTVVAMISNFLQQLWSQGGLMGDTAKEAFSVQCGLGSTMTGMDVLEGYMIVQVTLQMVHPAEFIELTFKQTMQGVA